MSPPTVVVCARISTQRANSGGVLAECCPAERAGGPLACSGSGYSRARTQTDHVALARNGRLACCPAPDRLCLSRRSIADNEEDDHPQDAGEEGGDDHQAVDDRRAASNQAGVPLEDVEKYQSSVNGLANMQLLQGGPNIEKQATLPVEWLDGPHFASEAAKTQYINDNDLGDLPRDITGFLGFYASRRLKLEKRLRDAVGPNP